jgi:hypothetical protein
MTQSKTKLQFKAVLGVLTIALTLLALAACGGYSEDIHQGVAPTIALEPTNQAINVGSTATFTVSANGTAPLTYQWYKGAAAISGANSASYTTPVTVISDSGSVFRATVSNAGGTATSTSATLTVSNVISVSNISPANPVLGPGQVTFSATASGGTTNQLTWSANGGTFNGTVWTSPVTAGTYTIRATSVDNTSVSSSTTATVTAPIFTTQPVSQNLCHGASTSLSVAASFALSYQWYLNGSPILNATSTTYLIPAAAAGNAGIYTAAATNAAGTTTSNVATIVVGSSITSNPIPLSIFSTQTATFSVAATGLGPFSYQWYVVPSGSASGTAIPNATSRTYTTPPVDPTYNGNGYYATVGDACGGTPLTSTTAALTVQAGNVPPTITTQPVGQAVTAGSTPTFTVAASGTPTLSYQWYYIPAGTVGGNPIGGANSASYTLPASSTAAGNDQDAYYVMVSNPYGQAVSQTATLAVGSGILLQITGQPTTVYVNDGAPATLSVTAASTASLAYQWYRAEPGTATFNPIDGATNASYTLATTSASVDNGAVYQVVVSNGGATNPVTSNSAGLFVGTVGGIDNLCSATWMPEGSANPQPNCSYQLTASVGGEYGEIVWPSLIATGNIQLSFTITVANPSDPPADGFAMVLGDPSLGATPTSSGATGQGLGAEGIPGFVLGFDTYENTGDPPVPYLGVGRGEYALWENPWFNVNTNIPPLAAVGSTISHNYVVSIVQGQMSVTMDGTQVFSGNVTVPPVAYLYVTASTGGLFEETDISNMSATVSAP